MYMGMVWENVLVNIVYVTSFVIGVSIFSGYTAQKSIKHICTAIAVIVIGSILLNRPEVSVYFFLIQIIEVLLVLIVIYNEKIKNIIGFTALFVLLHAVGLQMIEALLDAFQIIANIDLKKYNTIIELSIILFILIILLFVKNKTLWSTGQIKRKYIVILSIILVIDDGMLVIMGDYISKLINSKIIIVAATNYMLMTVVLIIQVIFMIYLISSREAIIEREELTRVLVEEQQKYYEDIIQRDHRTRKFRHDLNNHMNLLAQFCEEGKYDKIRDYLHEMSVNINQFGRSVNTNNNVADVLLARYIEECRKEGIELEIKGHFLNSFNFSIFDMCTIFSNILDNAIRAEKESGMKKISLTIRNTNDEQTIIVLENDIKNEPKLRNGKYITSKRSIENHGFGIENVKECVERNNGYYNFKTEGKKFRVCIWLENTGYKNCNC